MAAISSAKRPRSVGGSPRLVTEQTIRQALIEMAARRALAQLDTRGHASAVGTTRWQAAGA
jgi:hypothetical protein